MKKVEQIEKNKARVRAQKRMGELFERAAQEVPR